MGWTSYHARFYKRNGAVDRKAECDSLFDKETCRVVKSAMVGTVYYAAIENLKRYKEQEDGTLIAEDIPESERKIWGEVILTSTNARDYFNFSYKSMSEDMGPRETNCPASILSLLSETDSEWALDWRKACRESIRKKKNPNSLGNLPIGTVIRFSWQGNPIELIKHPAAYQFKRPFWYCEKSGKYLPNKKIPSNYEIVKIGG